MKELLIKSESESALPCSNTQVNLIISYEYLSSVLRFSHYSFYLRDGMSVLELGAAEESYLPEGLKLNRHVGIGAVKSQMEQNPSITDSYVVDLNDVVEDNGIKSVDFSNLGEDTFDAIIMANTIDFINNPREVFK